MNNTLKHKLVLLITQAFSITIDLVLLISLAVKGYSFLRYIMLIVLLVFEAIYLTTSFFTNYRFSYSTKVLIFHNIFTVACVALQFVSNKGNISAKLMTNYAILTFLVVHSAALLAIDLSAYVASRNTLFKVNKTASVFALIISIPALAFSVFFTFKEGFFGQGYGDRAVIYSYNEASDSYTAVGIAEGFGNRATIKKTFNNRPVDQINLSVFCYPSIKVLSIEERPNLDFVGFEKGFAVNTNTEVQTTNEFSKTIRKKLVDIALKENHTSAIDAANQVVPNDLKDNEYYVSFKLTKELLDITNGEYIDTIVVNGDTKLTNDIFPPLLKFIKYSDHLSDADLYWNYTNNNKKIFKSMKDSSGNDILGKSINKNYYNVEISFDDIYKIFINNDNDTKYEPSNEEKYIDVSGSLYRYKLTTYENAENILNSIKPRDGFSLEFSCNGTKFTSLKDLIISSSTNELSIDPVWSISFPSITNITCNHPNFTGIYGDDFSVTTAVAGSNRANYKFSYKYTFTGVTKVESSNPTLTLNNMYPVQSGSYYVAVTVYSDTETSLTKTISQSFTITVNKKPIDLEYTYDSSLVYDGETKTLSAQIKANQLINGDTLLLSDDSISYKDAGSYTLNPTYTSTKYVISSTTASKTINVSKRTISVEWGDSTFTYNGSIQRPSFTLTNTIPADNVTAGYSSANYANVGNYTASLYLDATNSKNYTISNPTKAYSIEKRNITVTIDDVTKTYDGVAPSFTHQITNLASTDTESSVFSLTYKNGVTTKVNAGTYTIDATYTLMSKGSNYNITIVPGTLTINKKVVSSLSWDSVASYKYSGLEQYPKAVSGNGVISSDLTSFLSSLIYNGQGTNVGNYTVTATLPTNSNYEFNGVQSHNYDITKAPLTISFTNTNKTYDGNPASNINVVFTGIKNNQNKNDIISYDLVCEALTNKNAGSYAISLTNIQNETYGANYEITVTPTTYTTTKREVSLVMNSSEFVYNGGTQYPTITKVNNIVEGEETAFISSLTATQTSKVCGDYELTVTNNDANYTLSSNSLKFAYKITPKPITVSFANTSLTYNSYKQIPTPAVNDVCAGDSVGVVFGSEGYKNVGSYSVSFDIDDSNYSITTKTVSYSIVAKELTVNVTNDTVTYNKTVQHPSIDLVGIEAGDTVNVIYAIDSMDAGTYNLPISSNNPNYTFDKNSVSLTINKIQATINVLSNTTTYNGSAQYPETSIDGVLTGDVVAIKYAVNPKNAGGYNLSISSSNGNYSFDINSIEFTITKATLTVSFDSDEFTYDGDAHRPIITLTGVVGSDEVEVVYADEAKVDAGEYTLHFSINNDNYVLNQTSVDYKIKEEA